MSPGLLLLVHLFKLATAEGLALFDFSNGDEEYKDRWSDGAERIMVCGKAFNPVGHFGLVYERAKLELIRAIKSHGSVTALARNVIRLGRSSMGQVIKT
jgi:CelD/BcsL family acetyltransferase involved in cellulose biosynthesis